MSTKPTIVIVPGAWHSPDGFAQVMGQLHDAGYPTITAALPSVDAPTALKTFHEDVQAIRKAIINATSRGQDVVVVCHSYAGVPVSQAVENLGKGGKDTGGSGGVVALFFCTAFLLPKGGSLLGALGGNDLPWWRKEGDHVFPIEPEKIFYNDLPEHQQNIWISSLRSFSYPMFSSELTYCGYKDIPTSYLFCTKDNAIPIEVQKGMVQGAGVDIRTESVDASHSPFLSQPKATADAIRRTAGEKI